MANSATSSKIKLEPGSFLSQGGAFKMYRGGAVIRIVALVLLAWAFIAPYQFTEDTDGLLIFFFWEGVALLALFFFYRAYLRPRAYSVFCPKCYHHINLLDPWVCAHCHHKNEKTRRYHIFHKCEKCRQQPVAYECEHCFQTLEILPVEPQMAAKRWVLPEVALQARREASERITREQAEKAQDPTEKMKREFADFENKLELAMSKNERLYRFRKQKLDEMRKLVDEGVMTERDFKRVSDNLRNYIAKNSEIS